MHPTQKISVPDPLEHGEKPRTSDIVLFNARLEGLCDIDKALVVKYHYDMSPSRLSHLFSIPEQKLYRTEATDRHDGQIVGSYRTKRQQNRDQLVLDRDASRCISCGSTRDIVIHHIVPKGKSGSDDITNKTVLCSVCHDWVHDGSASTARIIYNSVGEFMDMCSATCSQYC